MTNEKYLTISQASAYTGLSHRTIQCYDATSKLPSIKGDSGVRQISVGDLKTYAKTTSNGKKDGLTGILLEILALLPSTSIAALAQKQALRERTEERH
ncbi:hypothetical protein Q3O60_05275 [Alkalimonas collagenimarina]|uniref:Helix-turn-helix domain-containing protein n=1 Tax=Alkalimonas collagenimarina TaxID=400390 RepID=A0ABT9GX14_9GAMM|nr:hypothetical protein [Alkalimonas collagenimarina]MDP4535590.1 hypothetical protein [Alkalimonas collagenimarina]